MSVQQPIAVLGAGGHAKVVISALRASGEIVAAVFDDDASKTGGVVCGAPVQGPISRALELGLHQAVIAVGDNASRKRIAESFDFHGVQVQHPTAWVDPTARIGVGTVIFAHTVIQADTTLGDHVIVNTSATVDHDCVIASFVHLAPGSNLGGGVKVGASALIGLGASIKPYVSVGEKAVIGCGAAVVSDIAAAHRAVGVPARPLSD
jgi:sugar O-acyltransferase (sialic acid O-acetyltransferase NeuD family)